MWIVLALLSALFAGATAILAKCGIQKVNSNVATALRTGVVLIFSWLMVFLVGSQDTVTEIPPKTLIFLVLSGLSTGASWLFYFRALQLGKVAKVAAVDKFSTVLTMLLAMLFLQERPGVWQLAGVVLIAAGTFFMLERPAQDAQTSADGGTQKPAKPQWLICALLSALFASLTAIFGRIGITDVESNLGTALRTIVVLVFAWGIVFAQHRQREIRLIDRKSWVFLLLSGLTTGASWLCYYGALHDPQALTSVVVPIDKLSVVVTVIFSRIFLKERLSRRAAFGLVLLVAGTLLQLL